jgi:chemotaxis protein methyltransferase CheR
VLYTLGDRQWDISRLHVLLETVLPKDMSFENVGIEHDFPGIGKRKMLLNARQISGDDNAQKLILLAIEDITPAGRTGEKIKPANRDKKKD